MPQHLARVCVFAALLVAPMSAAAQPAAFVEGFSEFAAAIEGTFGDEGSRVGPALDKMANALARWDRTIADAELALDPRRVQAVPAGVQARVALARQYAQRGRRAAALRHVEEAVRLEPANADAHLLRGLLLGALDRPAEAHEAFLAASTRDPADPIKSYHLLRHTVAAGDAAVIQRTREALQAAYATSMRVADTAPLRFLNIVLVVGQADGPPLLPLHAYAAAYTRILSGDYDAAVAALRTTAAADPLVTDPAVRSTPFLQAVLALREGRLSAARAIVEGAVQLRESSEAHRVLGLVSWAESDHDASVRHLEAALRMTPHDERSRLALARVLTSAGRDAEAQRVLEETVRVLPDSALAHWWLATGYERLNRFDEARQAFERAAAAALGGRSTLLTGIGRLAARAADLPGAVDAFTSAVSANVDDPAAHMHLAAALHQQDRTDDALAEFIAAALIDPRQPRAHLGVGEMHLDAGRHGDAVAALRRALELSPALTEARFALATALTRMGDAQQAAAEFARVEREQRQLLTERRRSMALDVMKGEAALRAADGAFELAAAIWRQVVHQEPGRVANHLALAAALVSAGETDEAIGEYERAVALGAEPAVYRQLATLYGKSGRAQDAARMTILYERALSARGNPPGARR